MSTKYDITKPMIRYPRISPSAFVQPIELSKALTNNLGKMPGGTPDMSMLMSSLMGQLATFQVTQVLKKTMVPRVVTIGTTPTQIIMARSPKGYLIINPESVLTDGATENITFQSLVSVSGDNTSSEVNISNYRECHIWLDIISIDAGTPDVDFYLQSKDPVFGNWANVALIFPHAEHNTQVGTYYKHVGKEGIASMIRIRWDLLSGGVHTWTFRMSGLLKDALPGSAAGLARTVFLGGNNGVTTNAGFPLLEGQSWGITLETGAELWGVANEAVTMNIFELQ